jgi:hypothetical protein
MSVDVIESQSLGPVIYMQIKHVKAEGLNIVESPSVGTLVVPVEGSLLVAFALKMMLQGAKSRCSTRMKVRCTVDNRRKLWLEVIDYGKGIIGRDGKLEPPTGYPVSDQLILQLPLTDIPVKP